MLKVLLIASLSAPLLLFFNKLFIELQNVVGYRQIILASGVVSLFAIISLCYFLFRGSKDIRADRFFYGFALFCFTGVVDFIIGLEYDGKISGFMGEYIKAGEPYLNCPYGAVICYLDISVLFPLELFMCFCIAARKTYRNVAIYWSAVLFQSMMVLILSASYGKFGIYPSTFLNTLHFIFPIVVGWSFILNTPAIKITNAKSQSILKRPFDLLLVIISALSAFICFIRALTVLKSPVWIAESYGKFVEPHLVDEIPTPYLSTQVLIYMFYYMPLFLMCIYGLINPGCTWFINVVLILGGALLHGQLSHIFTSFHYNTPKDLRPTNSIFWIVNLILLILPQLLVLRVVVCPSLFNKGSGKVKQKNTGKQIEQTKMSNKLPENITKKIDGKKAVKAKQH